MKQTIIIAVCILVVRTAWAQVLNPGFETAGTNSSLAANWSTTTAAGGPVYGVRTNNDPHSGSFHYEVRLASTGGGPVVEFSQSSIPVTGGATSPFTFYAKALTGSAGYNLEWRILWNAGGDTGYHGFTPGNNVYASISNSVTAPLSATSATIFLHCAGAASPSLSATLQFDDVSLSATNIVGGGGGVTNQVQATIVRAKAISWFAGSGVQYQVQWSSDTNTWNNLGSVITGNGSSNTVVETFGQPGHDFYRVLSIQ
jgi:hypothetical protein